MGDLNVNIRDSGYGIQPRDPISGVPGLRDMGDLNCLIRDMGYRD